MWEALRKLGTYLCWAGALAATLGYAWMQLRAAAADSAGGTPIADPTQKGFVTEEGRAFGRRARLCSAAAVAFAIAAIGMMAWR